ncbi:type II toxin-antitoxin system HicB family antitoxin [Patescibacteria group bacterium]|nr:type II toxin-antitoxin system HicB family antitoxin [Patescibacteria group bacterium]
MIDVIIEKDKPAGYHAYCPDLPGCHSQGDTVEEARSNIAEAMQVYLER